MGGMTTFGNNDSVFSHGEDSISMLNRLAKIAKEAFKYIPENDCTVACGTFVDVDTRAFLSAVQHIRESIEAYRDLTEELDDDLRECRSEYEHDMDCIRKYGVQSVDAEKLFGQLNEELEDAVLNRDANLKLYTAERERSNQLEEKIRGLTTKFGLAKKFLYQRREEVSRLKEELRQTQIVKDAQKKVIDEKEKQICDLHHEIWELQDQVEYWEDLAKQKSEELKRMLNEKYGTDILHMYPKTTINNPANFCGNCRHYAQMGKDDGDFEGICTQHYIKRVDPDDASCSRFESNQVDRDKPDQPCCKACNRDDCDDCTLCPF